MPTAIHVVREAFSQLSTGQADVPLRVPIALTRHAGTVLFMPAYLSGSDALALKVVSIHDDNPRRGLPLLEAVILLLDPVTGESLAMMDGTWLTALRTGAASAVATDVLARADARRAAIFGAGVQGRAQLLGTAAVRELSTVYIYDRERGKAEQFIREMQGQTGVPRDLRVAATTGDAVKDADIICTATTSRTPVYDGNLVPPGAHVNGVGSYTREMQENGEALVRRADKIVVDSYAGALAEAGDLLVPMNKGILQESSIYAELGEITSGAKPGRERDSEITFFKSVGNAVQDAAVAQLAFRRAEELGLGAKVSL